MHVFHLPARRHGKSIARRAAEALALAPLRPDSYLRLRREAARLDKNDLAFWLSEMAIASSATDRHARALVGNPATARSLIDLLDQPGVVARYRKTIEAFARIFPLDVDVYFQLASEPAERHPAICRGCGCSAHDPCRGDLGVCSLENLTCTRCAGADAQREAA